jgi:hypothetical protein
MSRLLLLLLLRCVRACAYLFVCMRLFQPGINRFIILQQLLHSARPGFERFLRSQLNVSSPSVGIKDMATVRDLTVATPSANRTSYLPITFALLTRRVGVSPPEVASVQLSGFDINTAQ